MPNGAKPQASRQSISNSPKTVTYPKLSARSDVGKIDEAEDDLDDEDYELLGRKRPPKKESWQDFLSSEPPWEQNSNAKQQSPIPERKASALPRLPPDEASKVASPQAFLSPQSAARPPQRSPTSPRVTGLGILASQRDGLDYLDDDLELSGPMQAHLRKSPSADLIAFFNSAPPTPPFSASPQVAPPSESTGRKRLKSLVSRWTGPNKTPEASPKSRHEPGTPSSLQNPVRSGSISGPHSGFVRSNSMQHGIMSSPKTSHADRPPTRSSLEPSSPHRPPQGAESAAAPQMTPGHNSPHNLQPSPSIFAPVSDPAFLRSPPPFFDTIALHLKDVQAEQRHPISKPAETKLPAQATKAAFSDVSTPPISTISTKPPFAAPIVAQQTPPITPADLSLPRTVVDSIPPTPPPPSPPVFSLQAMKDLSSMMQYCQTSDECRLLLRTVIAKHGLDSAIVSKIDAVATSPKKATKPTESTQERRFNHVKASVTTKALLGDATHLTLNEFEAGVWRQ